MTTLGVTDPDGATPEDNDLHHAARGGNTTAIHFLLQRWGRDYLEARDNYGRTPLYLAALHGHADAVEALLGFGADPNARTALNRTPLSAADAYGQTEISQMLRDNGANPAYWQTHLCMAAQLGNATMVEELLDANAANRDRRDFGYGRTPLMWAAVMGHVEAVRVLLDADAVINMVDFQECTPWGLAADNRHTDIVNMIIVKMLQDRRRGREITTALTAGKRGIGGLRS
ncbi:ankyrin repeat-containing domain protein [Cercophora newfieldiana]|uniref:Ankyrin repeat-containing domain protein n=1 Tax=Cercophora newfieldiana TaxID=92897 RepID=A0AA40CW07_9PEZI|nr:ankyrin repeat-containing domain protein [Cercophora newfieldiana]